MDLLQLILFGTMLAHSSVSLHTHHRATTTHQTLMKFAATGPHRTACIRLNRALACTHTNAFCPPASPILPCLERYTHRIQVAVHLWRWCCAVLACSLGTRELAHFCKPLQTNKSISYTSLANPMIYLCGYTRLCYAQKSCKNYH